MVLLDALKTATLWLASGTEAAAALVISLAVVEGVFRALLLFIPRGGIGRAGDASQDAKEVVRLKLGRWLALALEFELAADTLRTAVAPSWSEINSRPSPHCGRRSTSSYNARSTAPSAERCNRLRTPTTSFCPSLRRAHKGIPLRAAGVRRPGTSLLGPFPFRDAATGGSKPFRDRCLQRAVTMLRNRAC